MASFEVDKEIEKNFFSSRPYEVSKFRAPMLYH